LLLYKLHQPEDMVLKMQRWVSKKRIKQLIDFLKNHPEFPGT
jgi:hypothetical protein